MTGQPKDGVRDVLRRTQPAHRMQGFYGGIHRGPVWVLGEQLLVERGVNPTGGDGVAADAIDTVLERGVMAKCRDRRFGGPVGAV